MVHESKLSQKMVHLDNHSLGYSDPDRYLDICTSNCSSNSSGNYSSPNTRSASLTTDWLSAYIFLRIIAICTNFAFVVAVYADKTSKGGPRLLIGNLSICGFLYCIGLYPIYTLQEWLPPGTIPSTCTIIAPTMFFMAAISWADVSLSVNRTVAICFPMHYNTFRGYKVTCALIGISWAISVFVPAVIGTGTGVNYVVVMLSSNSSFCTISTTNVLGAFSVGLCIPIPYMFIGIASLAIYSTAYVRMRNPPANASEAARVKRLINKRLVIVKAMLVSLLWNVVCSTPVLLTTSVPADDIRNQTLINNLEGLTPGLLYALNPLIYFWISPAYRQSFLSVARCPQLQRKRLAQVVPSGTGGASSQNQGRTTQSRLSGAP